MGRNKEKPSYHEMVIDLDDEVSIIEKSNDVFKEMKKKSEGDQKKKNPQELEKDSINTIFITAAVRSLMFGREIEKDEGEEIKL